MTAIRVSVTAERIDGCSDRRRWADPVAEALSDLTGQDVDIDGGDTEEPATCIATIGQDEWTLVVDLPHQVNEWLDRRWSGDDDDRAASEPFDFDLVVPEWVERFVGGREELEAAIKRIGDAYGRIPAGEPTQEQVNEALPGLYDEILAALLLVDHPFSPAGAEA